MLKAYCKKGLLHTLYGVGQSIHLYQKISIKKFTHKHCRLSLAIPGSDI